MHTKFVSWNKYSGHKLGKLALILFFALLFPGCRIRVSEPLSPERTFKIEELLLKQYAVPLTWEASTPFFPEGDDLCGLDCIAYQFREANTAGPGLAEHIIYRYPNSTHANRTFEELYLPKNRSYKPIQTWQYQSPRASQEHFGCIEFPKPTGLVCQWGGRYEEFIVVFRSRINLTEMSLENMEEIAKNIDSHMSSYLSSSSDSE